jgi:hypothetical protein
MQSQHFIFKPQEEVVVNFPNQNLVFMREEEAVEEVDAAEVEPDEDLKAILEIHAVQSAEGKFYMSAILKRELAKIRHLVLHKDRDWVGVVDGDEGSGKSVLAMQICKELDPNFNANNIVYNAEDFIAIIKKAHKGQAILLDEGYASINARASLSEVNRALVGLATEMRQKNLFVVICIPSFFDLDKYFAIHRSRALFHVYFNINGDRGQFIVYPKTAKKLLYLYGKKNYSYAEPHSPWPAMRFLNYYVVDELEYRKRKASAFQKRTASHRARQWADQRDSFILEMHLSYNVTQEAISKVPVKYGVKGLSQQHISRVLARHASRGGIASKY